MATNTASCTGRKLEGVIRGTNFRISGLSSGTNDPLGLVASFQVQFQRRLTRVYNLVEPSFFYVEGPAEGQVSLASVVGPRGLPRLACDCVPRQVVISASQVVCSASNVGGDFSMTLKNALPMNFSFQGQATDFLLRFSIGYLFDDIEYN